MRYRRIVCFLLGTWIGVSAMLAWNVFQDFSTVDRIVKAPPEQGSRIFKLLGPENTRVLLHYTVGQENVNTFETWEIIQIGIGLLAAALLFLAPTTRIFSIVPLAMVLLVAFLHYWIWPEMAWLDHLFTFGSPTAESQARDHFWKLHGIYLLVEAVKDALGLALAAILCLQQTTRRRSRRAQTPEHLDSAQRGFGT